MGCDIHMYVEYKKKSTNKWESGDFYRVNPYKEFEGEPEYSVIELHGNRNYGLFSTLAGVRDYSDKVEPVTEPKGFPDDACDFVKVEYKGWGSDAHTPSWLTLKEIRDYQAKDPQMFWSGLLSPTQLEVFDERGIRPEHWCQGTSQEGYERRDWSTPNEYCVPLIDKLQARALHLLQYDWQEYNQENDDNIRIVFWFDN
jgi:hypothetical protein